MFVPYRFYILANYTFKQLKLQNFKDRVNMDWGTCELCLFLDNAREMFGSSWDKVRPCTPYSFIFTLYISLLCFFTHLLKFYSGRAVDLWSCLYFCQYISWFISLLKIGQYRNNSSSGWDILMTFYNMIFGNFYILVCLSVSYFSSLWLLLGVNSCGFMCKCVFVCLCVFT